MIKLNKKQLVLIVRIALVVLIVGFFYIYLRGIDYDQLSNLSFNPPLLALSAFFSLLFRYWGVFIWRMILHDLGSKELPPFRHLSAIYAKSWMARYIPGTVTWIAGKIFLARDLGISKSRLAVASLVEAGIQIVALGSVSIVILSLDSRIDEKVNSTLQLLVLAGTFLLMLVLLPPVFNQVIRRAFKLIRRKDAYDELATNGKATARSFVLYALGSLLAGLSYVFLAAAIWPETQYSDFLYIVGAINLAGVLGMATPFVPSGLGVRDASQLLLLSAIFPKEIALAITVLSRLWTALVDVLFFFLATMLDNKRKKEGTTNHVS